MSGLLSVAGYLHTDSAKRLLDAARPASPDQRRAELQMLLDLYMRAPPGSEAEKYYEERLQKAEVAHEALVREERAKWGEGDSRILRDIANGYNGSEL